MALCSAPALGAEEWSLRQCYERVLARSESVALGEEAIAQAEGQYGVLRARILPRAGYKATARFQDTGGAATAESPSPRQYRPEAGFYLRQPLFSGFREYAAMKSQKALGAARTQDLVRIRQQLFEDVAEVFFTVLELDRQLDSLTELHRATADRLKDLRRRVAIGRSRRGEALSTESQLASLDAREEAARGNRAAALEILRYLTDAPVDDVKEDISTSTAIPPLASCLEKLPQRPDLLAAAEEEKAARFFESATRRQRWPTLDLEGNYYTERTGSNKPVDWDVEFVLDAPFFKGGQTREEIFTARSQARAASLRLAQKRRQAEEEIRVHYQNLLSAQAQARRLEKAVALAEENYQVQQEEYRLGLTNNLEVLSALNGWEEAKLIYDSQRLEVERNLLRLSVAVGDLPRMP